MTIALAHDVRAGDARRRWSSAARSAPTRAMWDPQATRWPSGSGWSATTTRGHGASPAPAGPYDARRPRPATCSTCSTTWRCSASPRRAVARRHGRHVARHPRARAGRAAGAAVHLAPTAAGPMWRERAATVRAAGTVPRSPRRWSRAGSPRSSPPRHPDVVARSTRHAGRGRPEGYAACCEAIAAMDLRGDLGRITAPTLVIAGAQDPRHAAGGPRRRDRRGGPRGAAGDARARPRTWPTSSSPAPVTGAAARARRRRGRAATGRPGRLSDARRQRHRQGMQVRREVLGDAHVDRAVARHDAVHRAFQDFITRTAWGDVWSRAGLDRRTRSMHHAARCSPPAGTRTSCGCTCGRR